MSFLSLLNAKTNYIQWGHIEHMVIAECSLYPHEIINPEFIHAIMWQESRVVKSKIEIFDSYTVSSKGAMGLMQILPKTLEWYNNRRWIYHSLEPITTNDIYHIPENIRAGIWIFSYYLTEENYDIEKALQRYSGNAKNYSKKVLERYEYYKGLNK